MLFTSDAADFAANPAFQAKLLLIGHAGLNALAFQFRVKPYAATWDSHLPAPGAARLSATISIALWLAILLAGRLIAYVATP